MFQETKYQTIESIVVKDVWGNAKNECTRNSQWLDAILSFVGEGFMGVKNKFKGICVIIANVYASCNISGKLFTLMNILTQF